MPRDEPTVIELLARGGWAIEDPQPLHEANPDTFWLPPADDLARLVPGASVRLIFVVVDQADEVRDGRAPYAEDGAPNLVVQRERMWLWVKTVDGDELTGVLKNLPTATHTLLVPGARVRFRRADVIDLDLGSGTAVTMATELEAMAAVGFPVLPEDAVLHAEDPRRAPSIAPSQAEACERVGVRPERPWAFSRILVDPALDADADVVYGFRFPPNVDRRDCGWILWTGDPDLDVALDRGAFEVLEVRQIVDRNRSAWAHLALPPGWAFVLGPDGREDVYLDPELLDP